MRIITTLALLAFPIAEIWILINLGQLYGWWVLLYLVVVAWLGLQLIRDEKVSFSSRMMQSLSQGGSPIKAMFGSARNIIAGILLIIPGVISDFIAVVLLLIPLKRGQLGGARANTQTQQDHVEPGQASPFKKHRQAANKDIIEGEFREIKEEAEKK